MEFLTVKEAAKFVGVSCSTITRLCRQNEHTGLVKRKDGAFLIDVKLLRKKYPNAFSHNGSNKESLTHHPVEEQKHLSELSQEILKMITNLCDGYTRIDRLFLTNIEECLSRIEFTLEDLGMILEQQEAIEVERVRKQERTELEMAESSNKLPSLAENKLFKWEWLNSQIRFIPLFAISIVLLFMIVFKESVMGHFGLVMAQDGQTWGLPDPLIYFIPASLYYIYSYLSERVNFYKITWIWRQ